MVFRGSRFLLGALRLNGNALGLLETTRQAARYQTHQACFCLEALRKAS
jgi:hypothetical protein